MLVLRGAVNHCSGVPILQTVPGMRTDTASVIWALIFLTASYPDMLTTNKSYDFLIDFIHHLKM